MCVNEAHKENTTADDFDQLSLGLFLLFHVSLDEIWMITDDNNMRDG